MHEYEIKPILNEDIPRAVEILRQDMLKNPEGLYHDEEWITALMYGGYAVGGFIDNTMIACLFAEDLLDNGIMLWFVAVDPLQQYKGYGKKILKEFEESMKKIGKTWIFLNGTTNSLQFYRKNGYVKNGKRIYEHLKTL